MPSMEGRYAMLRSLPLYEKKQCYCQTWHRRLLPGSATPGTRYDDGGFDSLTSSKAKSGLTY